MQVTVDTQHRLDPSKWLDSHGDYLYCYALVRVRDASVAEDLLQETLLAGVDGHQAQAGRSSERTWLVGIMKQKVIDHFRHVARNTPFQLSAKLEDEIDCFEESGPWRGHWREDCAPNSWTGDAGQCFESAEFWETFDRCLSQLPQQMAIAFTLREIDGLTSTEICEILNVTPNNLWALLHRSRSKLRKLLDANWFSRRAVAA